MSCFDNKHTPELSGVHCCTSQGGEGTPRRKTSSRRPHNEPVVQGLRGILGQVSVPLYFGFRSIHKPGARDVVNSV